MFSPRDYEVELLAAAYERNIIVCLESQSSKEFITLKLINEIANDLRNEERKNITLYIASDLEREEESSQSSVLINHLTDLRVTTVEAVDEHGKSVSEWQKVIHENQVIVAQAGTVLRFLEQEILTLDRINLLVIENCHLQIGKNDLERIISEFYSKSLKKPKILGLSEPIHGSACPSSQLEAKLKYLEQCLHSKIETASDILNVLRFCSRPSEFVVQNRMPEIDPLTNLIVELLLTKITFLNEHRFDPSEIYSDEFAEEWKHVPDPKIQPLALLHDFLDILMDLGPVTAEKAALHFIIQIEKLKIKTAYERHFLLLSLVSSTFVQVRIYCDFFFRDLPFKEKITAYTTPKVTNLLNVIKQFKPKPQSQNSGKEEKRNHNRGRNEVSNRLELEDKNTNEVSEIDSLNFKDLLQSVEEMKAKMENGAIENGPESEVKATLKQMTTKTQPEDHKAPFRPRKRFFHHRQNRFHHSSNGDNDALCGIIFCDSKYMAKALFSVIHEVANRDSEFSFLNVQYTVEKCSSMDLIEDSKEVENEHRKQEEVLKRFRNRECNLLVGTSVLEKGIDLPKCNLVVRWDPPRTYNSYVQTKGKANTMNAFHLIMVSPVFNRLRDDFRFYTFSPHNHSLICSNHSKEIDEEASESNSSLTHLNCSGNCSDITKVFGSFIDMETATLDVVDRLAEYSEIEKILLKNCYNSECNDVLDSDNFNDCVTAYQPIKNNANANLANLSNSIALINNYCAKLPSDTFTKLVPLVRYSKTSREGVELFQCTVRLPINSPLKRDIVGLPMPRKCLAGRMAALIGCKMLHQSGELDDNLQPIGKEDFRASEVYFKNFQLEQNDSVLVKENIEPRPGTTKRRQYYFKKIASVLTNCRPTSTGKAFLYHIKMVLKTPIPEEQNTRGRKIYAPEDCPLGFGILIAREIPKLCSFPIFTRSGELEVSFVLADDNISLKEGDILKINHFIRYTFTNVLRLQKYLMFFDETAVENCFFIVPTVETKERVKIDWEFLETINNQPAKFKCNDERKSKDFDETEFKDAVVMPWYRNQDQPQYFYVAEICKYLSPESSFPGVNYTTFREYYFRKYGIDVQNRKQPLLDVDHTSARLNFLTPRYVNRKGVALPTSSEETKKAKRENLEQKQILIPELCTIHPFPASLWRAAVCLPCILYRLNALLLADEIRIQVASDFGLGQREIRDRDFRWPTLNFGWSLNDMLRKHGLDVSKSKVEVPLTKEATTDVKEDVEEAVNGLELVKCEKDSDADELEIGMWDNQMAISIAEKAAEDKHKDKLCRYGSPTLWDRDRTEQKTKPESFYSDSDDSFQSDDNEEEPTGHDPFDNFEKMDDVRLRIKFESNNVAEAFESEATIANRNKFNRNFAKSLVNGFNHFDMDLMEKSDYFQPDLVGKFETEKRQTKQLMLEQKLITNGTEIDVLSAKAVNVVAVKHLPIDLIPKLVPYLQSDELNEFLTKSGVDRENPKLSIEDLFQLNERYLQKNGSSDEKFQISGYGDLFDKFEDHKGVVQSSGSVKEVTIKFTNGNIIKPPKEQYNIQESLQNYENYIKDQNERPRSGFSFDYQPDLNEHPGPSPSIILQALTMSNANDGINLERLETIGDSFLKFAITTYLYCTYENVHEGKLSHLRSKYVSNLNLYRLGRMKKLGEIMISTKFEPHDNWLPPCYYIPKGLEKVLIEAQIPIFHWNLADLKSLKELSNEEICELIKERASNLGYVFNPSQNHSAVKDVDGQLVKEKSLEIFPCFIPYNLVNQHSIPDKSIADCVEALIGAYLIECGPRGALLFMAWIGICVLPCEESEYPPEWKRYPGSSNLYTREDGTTFRKIYGTWTAPKSPSFFSTCHENFDYESEGFLQFEQQIQYKFNDPLYLLQAMTHASYSPNRLTDCYQRLEFLGDAVLDYLITRHLYEDPRQHSPGALTDLRSALVNNTIFASLAVRHGFHKYFRHLSPGLNEVIDRFVRIQHENGYTLSDEVSEWSLKYRYFF